MIDGRISWPESSLLPWLVVVQCVKRSPQEEVEEYAVGDGEKANCRVILDVSLITFDVEYENSCVLPRARDTAFE